MPEPVCVRCGGPVGLTVDVPAWHCPTHGEVEPLHAPLPAEHYHLRDVASSSAVPVWIPLPLPVGWAVSGVRRTGGTGPARAVAVSYTGPGLAARTAEMVIVAEEPGVGLGAQYAGIVGTDPGPEITGLPRDTAVTAGGHPTSLWSLPVSDRSAYVGEAAGCWLWIITWPVTEWMVVHDGLALHDLRVVDIRTRLGEVPVSALTPRLSLDPPR
ncbi:DUF6758 family protein [Longivirga aurantiaca]|uniref:DUF6758 family protein n=1 Tax=Longivirga aurantiaca TaxID=1837743 RepID=A0ABW1SYE3_9ACTN